MNTLYTFHFTLGNYTLINCTCMLAVLQQQKHTRIRQVFPKTYYIRLQHILHGNVNENKNEI